MGAITKMNRAMRSDDSMRIWWNDDGVYWECQSIDANPPDFRVWRHEIDITGFTLEQATEAYWNHIEENH